MGTGKVILLVLGAVAAMGLLSEAAGWRQAKESKEDAAAYCAKATWTPCITPQAPSAGKGLSG